MSAPDEVIAAVKRGWSVIPIKADKRPFGRWKAAQERAATVEEVNAQAERNPPAWAVVTGAVSGLVVLDFDGELGMTRLAEFGFEPNVSTGSGGSHVFFCHPGHRVPTLNGKAAKEFGRKLPGVDLKGDGGYAIFVGRNGSGPYELRSAEALPWAAWPEAVAAALAQPSPGRAATASLAIGSASASTGLVQAALRCVSSGEARNNVGFELACGLRDAGLAQADALRAGCAYVEAVPPTDQHGRHEPYTQREWSDTVRSAYSRPPRVLSSTAATVDELTALLALDAVGRRVEAVNVYGRGSAAVAVVLLDDGARIVLDPIGRFGTTAKLAQEIALQVGAEPVFKPATVTRVMALLYQLGEHVAAFEIEDRARDLAASYLGATPVEAVDMADQADRWRAFSLLARCGDPGGPPRHLLEDVTTGHRYVRVQWLVSHLRQLSAPGEAEAMLAALTRLGWSKPGRDGQIKATRPGGRGALHWAFAVVPAGWEDA